MDPNDATREISHAASQIESFLTQALAGGEQSVVALQERARAAGLLSERQSITDSKPFKSAKTRLGVQSKRVGFGPRRDLVLGIGGHVYTGTHHHGRRVAARL